MEVSYQVLPGCSITGPDTTSRRPGDTKVTQYDEEECDSYTGNKMGVHAIEIFMLDTNEQDDLEISVIALLKQSLAQ